MAPFIPEITGLNEKPRALLQRLSSFVGQDLRSDLDVVKAVEAAIAPEIIERLMDEGLTQRELQFVISPRTLSHRIKNRQVLTTPESERSVRLAKLLLSVEDTFGDTSESIAWLRRPMHRFEGKSPLEMASTESGARLVEQLIAEANEGYLA